MLIIEDAKMQDIPHIEVMLAKAKLPIVGVRRHIAHFRLGKYEQKVVAVGGLELYGEQALLRSIVVDPEHRNKAYGRKIVNDLREMAQLAGIHDLYLKTVTASLFFEDLGFRELSFDQIPTSLKASSQFRGSNSAFATVMHLALPKSGK